MPIAFGYFTFLFYFPGVAGVQEVFEAANTLFGDHVGELLVDDVLEARGIGPSAENSDGSGESGAVGHGGKKEGVMGARVMDVVNEEIAFGDAVAQLDDFQIAVGDLTYTFFAILAEDHGLAVFKLKNMVGASFFFGDVEPCAIIEDIAILQDFGEGGALVSSGGAKSVLEVTLEDVDGAGDEGGVGADGEGDHVEGTIGRAVWSGLGDLADFGSRRILTLS